MCEILLLHCSHYKKVIIVLTAHAHLHTIRWRGTVLYWYGVVVVFNYSNVCNKNIEVITTSQQLHCAPTSCFGPDLAHPNKPPGTYYRLATSSSAMANGSPQVRRDDLKETDSAGFDWEEIDQPVTPTDREHLIAPPKPAVQVK